MFYDMNLLHQYGQKSEWMYALLRHLFKTKIYMNEWTWWMHGHGNESHKIQNC